VDSNCSSDEQGVVAGEWVLEWTLSTSGVADLRILGMGRVDVGCCALSNDKEAVGG
jgi:hypothetical protein